VLIKFQILIKILVGILASTKDSKSRFEVIMYWFKSSHLKIASSTRDGVKLVWIVFWMSQLGEEDR